MVTTYKRLFALAVPSALLLSAGTVASMGIQSHSADKSAAPVPAQLHSGDVNEIVSTKSVVALTSYSRTSTAKRSRPKPTPTPTASTKPTPTPTPTPTTTPVSSTTPSPTAAPSGAQLGAHVAFGAFAGGFAGSGTQVAQFENQLGAKVKIASSFRGVGDVFPAGEQLSDAASGHSLLISWHMGDDANSRFTTYTNGSHDGYLNSVAESAKRFGSNFYVRPWPEVNADWSTFQPTADGSRPAGGTPAQFIAAWQHVVNLFRAAGATNVKWVFNPTTDTYAETTDVRSIYPGSAYVDVMGLDGYNWGTGGNLRWRTFTDVYTAQYQRLATLAPQLPVWVCEFGSKQPLENDGAPIDSAHAKANWYSEAFASTSFPAIKAMVMFDIAKERNWRVGSDQSTLTVVSTAVRAAQA